MKENEKLIQFWITQGWKFRSKSNTPMIERKEEYKKRLQYELDQIVRKDFVDYFLVISDAVRWAKDNKIPVGPARGSAAASLVAYLLRITEIDPMQFPTMLFARFIDPNRLDLPDVDLDFADDRRHEVVEYLERKYGKTRIGNIGNFTRYRGKNSVDDVARVYHIPKHEAETVKRLIVERSGGDARQSESLADTFLMFDQAQNILRRYPDLAKATRLEGNYRGLGIHAAGIVISNAPITDTCAVYTRRKSDGTIASVIAYDKKDAEYVGMLKADFLGLTTMGMIGIALDLIGMDLEDLYRVPITDEKTLRAFANNDLVGIFQFEGRATAIVNRDVQPSTFGHLADVNALSRPGPLFSGMTAQYVNVKHGREERERLHPVVDALTEWTYGQIVYQEQVLSIVKDLAGFPIERVGDIRRIISQKLGNMAMANALEEFIDGCRATHDVGPELARKIWNYIATSSTYSFCVTGDTVLERGGAGKNSVSAEITAEQLWENANDRSIKGRPLSDKIRAGRLNLKSMSDDGRIRLDRLKNITRIEEYQCSTITTVTGRNITVSNDHPILTDKGYKIPLEMQAGDRVVVDLGKEAREAEKQADRRNGVGKGWAKGMTWVDGKRMEIDGRTRLLNEAKAIVRERSASKCEKCDAPDTGDEHCLEFAHIMQLNDCDGDYEKHHAPANIMHLCNSCHKKFDWQMQRSRKARWSYGNPTGFEVVQSIAPAGLHTVYDLEMEGDQHNYIGNGFVNHNNQSHSVSYSMLAFWCMWLKVNYPKEFYAAVLNKTGNGKDSLWQRAKVIHDADKNGIRVLPPSLGRSQINWTSVNEGLLGGFLQVHGIGDVTANKIVDWRSEAIARAKASGEARAGKTWYDLTEISGIGPKTIDKILDVVYSDDPYQINRTKEILDAARAAVRSSALPSPTHHSTEMPQTGVHQVCWIGLARNLNFKDYVEATRTRTGRDEAEILAEMRDPDLRKSCVIQAYDEGEEDVYIRINRYRYPDFEEELQSISKDEDVVVVFGTKREDFGISIHVDELWILQMDHEEEEAEV